MLLPCLLASAGDSFDGGEQLAHFKRLPQRQATRLLDEFGDLWIVFMPRHENEALAKVRADSLNRQIKHIPGKVWHHHVAQDGIKVAGKYPLHPFCAGGYNRDGIVLIVKHFLQDFDEITIILKH
jgi:hypothetical protein